MSQTRSSGDAVADRRFAWAMEYKAAGDLAAATELVEQALEIAGGWAAGWLTLGELNEVRGEREQAVSAYRRSLTLDPADLAGAAARLARLGEHPAEGAVSAAHVAALFDDYAARFETSLVQGLAYRGPDLLREALARHRRPLAFGHAIDLGCGTGLAAQALRDVCTSMDGVDLSAGMLAEARRKGLYRSLVQADVGTFLEDAAGGSADLIVSADVFVYIGDLADIFRLAARVLSVGGLFAFSVQRHEGPAPFVVGQDLRYAHGAQAIAAWAAASGLAILSLEQASTRLDAGSPVPGLIGVLRRA